MEKNTKVITVKDIYYCEANILLDDSDPVNKYWMIENYLLDGFIVKYIDGIIYMVLPANTVMTYLTDEKCGWPTFKIGTNEYDFCDYDDLDVKVI